MGDVTWTDESDQLLRTWLQRARYSQHSHYEQAKVYTRANYVLAVPVIVITSVLGTAAFASFQAHVSSLAKLLFGALSMLRPAAKMFRWSWTRRKPTSGCRRMDCTDRVRRSLNRS